MCQNSPGIGRLLLGSQILLARQLPGTVTSHISRYARTAFTERHPCARDYAISVRPREPRTGASAPLRDSERETRRSQVPLLISGRAGTQISGFRPRGILFTTTIYLLLPSQENWTKDGVPLGARVRAGPVSRTKDKTQMLLTAAASSVHCHEEAPGDPSRQVARVAGGKGHELGFGG